MRSITAYTHEDCDDDDLTPFSNILGNIYNNQEKSTTKWIGPSETITINNRVLSKGFVYVSQSNSFMELIDNCSIINERLEVSSPKYTFELTELNRDVEYYKDATLGYFPSYTDLSKESKGVYLDWLASSRQDPNIHIGYVFIYFYGLENRIIDNVDDNNKVSDHEYIQIYQEVARLNKAYSHNKPFKSYSDGFLSFLSLNRTELCENDSYYPYNYILAKLVSEGRPVNGELAWTWFLDLTDLRLPKAYLYYKDEFKQLFKIYYENKFGDGLKIKPNKRRLTIYYKLSNKNKLKLNIEDLPDPSILKSPMKKFNEIAMSCLEELKQYGRYLAKENTSKDDIEALILLPDILVKNSDFTIINKVKKWANKAITENNGLISFVDLWNLIQLPIPKNINKKENELIQRLFNKINVSFAPDIRFHEEKIKVNGNLVLFTPALGKFFKPSENFKLECLNISLGVMVSMVDEHINDQEKQILLNLIDYNDDLSPKEKLSLNAYLRWRMDTPLNTRNLKAKLNNLSNTSKNTIRDLIISIVLANGVIETHKIHKLEKLYTALGFDKSLALKDLHNTHSRKIKSGQSTSFTVHMQTSNEKNEFSLDEKSLALHEENTKKSQLMLESIFNNDDNNEEEKEPPKEDNLTGLSNNYLDFYKELSLKEMWKRIDVEEKAKKFNLMVDGALEVINDWSYEMVDAPVIEDDGHIYIDLDIVEELKQN